MMSVYFSCEIKMYTNMPMSISLRAKSTVHQLPRSFFFSESEVDLDTMLKDDKTVRFVKDHISSFIKIINNIRKIIDKRVTDDGNPFVFINK